MKRLIVGIVLGLLLSSPAHATDTWGDAADHLRPYTDFAQVFWAKRGISAVCPGDTTEVMWWDHGWGESGAALEGFGIPCQISISPRFWQNTSQGMRCTIVVHEWGHLAGLSHEPNPDHIMYPYPRIHPACRQLSTVLALGHVPGTFSQHGR